MMIPTYILQYKERIAPKQYEKDMLTNYLTQHYQCEDITETYRKSIEYSFTRNNFISQYGGQCAQEEVVYRIKEDENSRPLYDCYSKEGLGEEIIVFVEKNTGYVETDSRELFYELRLYKSVSQEDYDGNSLELLDLLCLIHMEETGG